jgi:hypothetical protein
MKLAHQLLISLVAATLASCTSQNGPVYPPPANNPVQAPARPKRPAAPKPDGALRPVPSTPLTPPKPKAFPDIPLKEDTGVSPLIHNRPDTPTYKRSGS